MLSVHVHCACGCVKDIDNSGKLSGVALELTYVLHARRLGYSRLVLDWFVVFPESVEA